MAGHQPAPAPALPEGGKWSIHTFKGWVSCGGWQGSIHVPVSYHSNRCQILMLMLGSLSQLYRIISYHIITYHIISYHIIAPTLAPNLTHPCCMPPTYRKPSPKRGKSAPKTTLTNLHYYIKPINIVKTTGEIIRLSTAWQYDPPPELLERDHLP